MAWGHCMAGCGGPSAGLLIKGCPWLRTLGDKVCGWGSSSWLCCNGEFTFERAALLLCIVAATLLLLLLLPLLCVAITLLVNEDLAGTFLICWTMPPLRPEGPVQCTVNAELSAMHSAHSGDAWFIPVVMYQN